MRHGRLERVKRQFLLSDQLTSRTACFDRCELRTAFCPRTNTNRLIKRRPIAGLLPLDLLAVAGFDMAVGKGEIHTLDFATD